MTIQYQCSMCGTRGEFNKDEKAAVRDNNRCSNCRSMQRQRDIAQIIVDEFGCGQALSLEEAVRKELLQSVSIYEVGMVGPFRPRLSRLPKYTNSYYWEDIELGSYKEGVRCEDLRRLTFDDNSFDLILSAEVLEHVFDMDMVLKEICRVLKPNGVHIFSIPNRYPFPDKCFERARIENDELQHFIEPHYHIAGDGGKSLVVTDFGADFVKQHEDAGLKLSIIRRSGPQVPLHQNATFVARRMN